ncbi:hypothetical protein AB434_3833 [Heyndrickxia coagulans]|uniref:Uncharacterized protein n=1 Tax=Heyndrickxia coagulans TaxID=1398 RepID=A0AAN0WBE9_HEYCO|nr:hypothetical protein SB48_HM08orf02263 [Heyndrickxia coagulans]AKN56238.1 hypothetical protein AB434_3833 [Heyndrickxia coagulans]
MTFQNVYGKITYNLMNEASKGSSSFLLLHTREPVVGANRYRQAANYTPELLPDTADGPQPLSK